MNETPILEKMYTNFFICVEEIQERLCAQEEVSETDMQILEISKRLLSIRGSDPLV